MRPRITLADLQWQCDRLNKHFGYEMAPYTRTESGPHTPNPHVYHLSQAYGGVSVHQMMETGTGIREVLSLGHAPKREVYDRMSAFIAGIYLEAKR